MVLFMPDQLRADCVGAFGNPVVRTPHIDALAARGTLFRNTYSQHSVCSPSRVSMLTGWYPHVTGHRTLTHLLKPWEPNVFRLLKEDGYNVAWVGQRGDTFAPGMTEASTSFFGFMDSRPDPKVMFAPCPYPRDHKLARAYYWGPREGEGAALDLDEANVRTAEQWLAEGPREPWVLFVALLFPHPPFTVEEPWFSLHARSDVPPPVDTDLAQKPKFMREIREAHGTDRLDEKDWREVVATYYGMISRVDDQLGRVLRAVDRAGCAERTYTFFFTDHGEYLGDYGLVEKWPSGQDDCLLRNPLVVAGPRVREGAACESFVEMIDLMPTLLDLGETEASHTHFGRSLVPVLTGADTQHRDAAFAEGGFIRAEEHQLETAGFPYDLKTRLQREDPVNVGKTVSLRTDRWTYVYRLYERCELYDRQDDPRELRNLSGSREVAGVEQGLRDRLLAWMVETADVVPWDGDPRFEAAPRDRRHR
jgi:arylsulfatase A-like enzyme